MRRTLAILDQRNIVGVTSGLANIEAADFLTAVQKRAILHENAARFLRLDAERPRH